MLTRTLSAISRGAAYMAAFALLAIAVTILVEIVLRTIFHTSTFMATELVGYGVAAMSFLALAHAFDQGEQIRVGILPNLLKRSRYARAALEIACCLATLFILGLTAWTFGNNVLRQYERGYWSGTMSQMPMWVPQGLVLLGLVICIVQVFTYLVSVIATRRVPEPLRPAGSAVE